MALVQMIPLEEEVEEDQQREPNMLLMVPLDEEEEQQEDISWWDQFHAAWDTTHRDTEDWGMIVEARMPMGELFIPVPEDAMSAAGLATPMGLASTVVGTEYNSPRELYGDEFMDEMSYDERLAFLRERRDRLGREGHEDVIARWEEGGESTSAQMSGTIAKTLLTPTMMLPFGKTKAAQAVIGAGIGAEISLSHQLAQEGKALEDVDVGKVAVAAAGGAVLAPATSWAMPYIGRGIAAGWTKSKAATNKVAEVVQNRLKDPNIRAIEEAEKLVDRMEETLAEEVVRVGDGPFSADLAWANTVTKLELTPEDLIRAQQHTPRKAYIPNLKEAEALVRNMANPTVTKTKLGKAVDAIVTPISTRLGEISTSSKNSLRKMEMSTHIRVAENLDALGTFLKTSSKLAGKRGAARTHFTHLENALFNGKTDEAQEIVDKFIPELAGELPKITEVLNKLWVDAKSAGMDVGFLAGYFPRKIKPGKRGDLLKALGPSRNKKVSDALQQEAERLGLHSSAALDDDVADVVINRILMGETQRAGTGGALGFTRHRVIQNLDPSLQRFYLSAPESLSYYIGKTGREIEQRNFFGAKNIVRKPGRNEIDLQATTMKYAEKQGAKEGLTGDQKDDLAMLLYARFDGENKILNGWVAKGRDLQYAALLGHVDAAAIQLGDMGVSMYLHGLGHTFKALVEKKKNQALSVEDLGLLNKVAAEMNSTDGWQKFLTFSLGKASGFARIDRLGKDVLINASYKKAKALATKDSPQLRKELRETFGDEADEVLANLKSGEITDNVKLLLWNSLSDAQPISLSEMPQRYLEMDNGRIFYALKTFGLKQLDLVRRTIVQEARHGSKEKAFINAVKYGIFVGGSNLSVQEARHVLLTGELSVDDITDKGFEAMASMFFLNKYTRERYIAEGRLGEAFTNLVTPPVLTMGDEPTRDLIKMLEGDGEDASLKFIQRIPGIGKLWYHWMLGGAEKRLERERRAQEKKDYPYG